ncbi:ketopantoate reductase PanE/ApbA C terminal-domain-containing protein [Piptocephalis cylindrospora]|uniref:2-dehydropantoate 2-reductase n=1 Tax=Piptocephalis cylindrospora TaxID=1907219 RepID=A0A4V1IYP9_9FUNG|nr:ketopantoate reductase PanE/ApbA C terminal-domain-containing protein [Piptocephalis cylindrospora]|eukprot:RKP15319.1 ketopantoate reductase PanE/ApbA C terminal-domain-containing protein [Piptocephalis cylindrospora]
MPPHVLAPTIHVLGGGAIGLLVTGHLLKGQVPVRLHLRQMPSVPTCLIPLSFIEAWRGPGTPGQVLQCPVEEAGADGPIECLVIATKAQQAREAVGPLYSRLTRNSSVLFLQNGLGVFEEVANLWKEERDRQPFFLLGSTTHGAYRPAVPGEIERSVVHAGMGKMWFGAASAHENGSPRLQNLVRNLSSWVPGLALDPRLLDAKEIRDRLVEKLAVASIILPLTALSGQKNGALLSPPLETLATDLAEEVSSVLVRTGHSRMTPSWVKGRVREVAEGTRENVSSMKADVEMGRRTEVEYICGALNRMARDAGIHTPLLRMVQGLIEARQIRKVDNET